MKEEKKWREKVGKQKEEEQRVAGVKGRRWPAQQTKLNSGYDRL